MPKNQRPSPRRGCTETVGYARQVSNRRGLRKIGTLGSFLRLNYVYLAIGAPREASRFAVKPYLDEPNYRQDALKNQPVADPVNVGLVEKSMKG